MPAPTTATPEPQQTAPCVGNCVWTPMLRPMSPALAVPIPTTMHAPANKTFNDDLIVSFSPAIFFLILPELTEQVVIARRTSNNCSI
jgi:hypothetical protein